MSISDTLESSGVEHSTNRGSSELDDYLSSQDGKSLLRFITCGSVDDGKSTLIGRLLYDSKMIYDDQLSAVERDSKTSGTTGEAPDLALLVDGLAAEREQGITIDVAYRFFSTDKRKFIVADTPGHEQYTRNMATGASTADVAVLLIDARYGVQVQTRRHAFIASLLGVRHAAVVINKMDLVDFSEEAYTSVETEFRAFAEELDFETVTFLPVSALDGDNVSTRSGRTPWYDGPTLLEYLETVDVRARRDVSPFRFPVQLVTRPHLDFRGYAGTVVSGTVVPGDEILTLPSGQRAKVSRIVSFDGDLQCAGPNAAVTLVLDSEIDISRGDLICGSDTPAVGADQFEATLIWMDQKRLFPGRQYIIRSVAGSVTGSITRLKHRIDVNDLSEDPARALAMNEIGLVNLALSKEIAFDPYSENRAMGSFIVVDRMSNRTVGAGMINHALRRSQNITRQGMTVDRSARSDNMGQKPLVLWFTGLSGAGKSTIANLVEEILYERGHYTYALDGDNLRHGLNTDLSFTKADRVENIRRVAEVANLMVDAGLIVTCSFISPFRAERKLAREKIGDENFLEIHVDTPLEVAESRDVKGLYAKARAGEIKNFTGIDSEYQVPKAPGLSLDTVNQTAREAAETVIAHLEASGHLPKLG